MPQRILWGGNKLRYVAVRRVPFDGRLTTGIGNIQEFAYSGLSRKLATVPYASIARPAIPSHSRHYLCARLTAAQSNHPMQLGAAATLVLQSRVRLFLQTTPPENGNLANN